MKSYNNNNNNNNKYKRNIDVIYLLKRFFFSMNKSNKGFFTNLFEKKIQIKSDKIFLSFSITKSKETEKILFTIKNSNSLSTHNKIKTISFFLLNIKNMFRFLLLEFFL
jgi:hypothetical protein